MEDCRLALYWRYMVRPSKPSKRSFRRWYERRLYESFSWLGLCLFAITLFLVVLEFIGFSTPGVSPFLTALALYLIGMLVVHAFIKFWFLLSSAQRYSEGATCSECNGYGLFDVALDDRGMHAACRRCGNRWTIAVKTRSAD